MLGPLNSCEGQGQIPGGSNHVDASGMCCHPNMIFNFPPNLRAKVVPRIPHAGYSPILEPFPGADFRPRWKAKCRLFRFDFMSAPSDVEFTLEPVICKS